MQNRFATVKTIINGLNVSVDQATLVRDLIKGAIEPDTIDATAAWINECYNRPSDDELIMHAVNAVLDGHGIETFGPELGSYYGYGQRYVYVNMGDVYNGTVIYDRENNRYRISTVGDIVEREDRHGTW